MRSFNRIKCLNIAVSKLIELYNLNDCVVADVATDHGYLAELISRNNSVSKVIASDISSKCLEKTNILKNKFLLKKIETKLGDGLEPIDRADIVVMAGIGGYEIIKILSNQNITKNNKKKCSKFILQPSKNDVELREWILSQNIEIISDYIVKSCEKFYPIITIDLEKKSTTEINIFNVYFGKSNNIESKDFVDYLIDKKQKLLFLEKINEDDIKNSNDLKTKNEIFHLVNILLKSKGE